MGNSLSGFGNMLYSEPQSTLLQPLVFVLYLNNITVVTDQGKFVCCVDDIAVLLTGNY